MHLVSHWPKFLVALSLLLATLLLTGPTATLADNAIPYLVYDINPTGSSKPNELTDVNGTLFFVADDGSYSYEHYQLWKSDGAVNNTVMVKDFEPHYRSDPHHLTNVGGTLFFVVNDGIHGVELWKSDGTEAGTVLVKDIHPDDSSSPSYLTDVNGTLFFQAAASIIVGNGEWCVVSGE